MIEISKKEGYEIPGYPDWVETRSDFQVWEFEADKGVPSKQFKKLNDAEALAQKELKEAQHSGKSEEELLKLHLKTIEAGQAIVEFLDDYL